MREGGDPEAGPAWSGQHPWRNAEAHSVKSMAMFLKFKLIQRWASISARQFWHHLYLTVLQGSCALSCALRGGLAALLAPLPQEISPARIFLLPLLQINSKCMRVERKGVKQDIVDYANLILSILNLNYAGCLLRRSSAS